jgi:lantibiotic modifying enzyme
VRAELELFLYYGVLPIISWYLLSFLFHLIRSPLALEMEEIKKTKKLEQDWVILKDVMHWMHENTKISDHYDIIMYSNLIRENAASGNIDIRGFVEIIRDFPSDRFDTIRKQIKSIFWETHKFDLAAISTAGQHDQPETVVVNDGNMDAQTLPHYNGLQADMKQVKKLWS